MTEWIDKYEFEVRIAYADTDRMGVVYYGNYFRLFERGRTELMRNFGIRYRDLEENDHIYLPVSETHCRYLAPVRYDELIKIKTWVKEMGPATIEFEYEIVDAETQKKLAEGFTRHPFLNDKWKPIRVPKEIRAKLTPPPVRF